MPAIRISEATAVTTAGQLKGLKLNLRSATQTRQGIAKPSSTKAMETDGEGNVVRGYCQLCIASATQSWYEVDIYYPQGQVERDMYRTAEGKVKQPFVTSKSVIHNSTIRK